MESVSKSPRALVGMERRIEVWRSIKNCTPEQLKDARMLIFGGVKKALIDVDVNLLTFEDVLTDAGLQAAAECCFKGTGRPAVFDYVAIGDGAIGGTADSGSTTTTVDSERTEADDYWNGAYILFTSGPNDGLSRKIADFDAATDTITHEAFPNAVASGHTYLLTARPATTALESEYMRGQGDYTNDPTDGEVSMDEEFSIDATKDLNECGLFNDAAAGTMYCGDVYKTKSVISGDTVKLYYTPKFQVP